MMRRLTNSAIPELALALALIALACALRWWAFSTGRTEFDGDEAVASLMAKDIWLGRERPLYFYGQTYGGAIESYLTAPVFALRERADVDGARLAGLLMMIAGLAVFYGIIRRGAGPPIARLALAAVALGPGYFAIWSLKQRGGYLLLGPISLGIIGLTAAWPAFAADRPRARRGAIALGFLIGLGWWTHRSVIFALLAAIGLRAASAWKTDADIGGAPTAPLNRRILSVLRTLAPPALALALAPVLDGAGAPPDTGAALSWAWRLGPCLACLIGYAALEGALSPPGRRALPAWGVAAFAVGYLPALAFVAAGGESRTPFEPAGPASVALNFKLLWTELLPTLFGVGDLLAADDGADMPWNGRVIALAAAAAVALGIIQCLRTLAGAPSERRRLALGMVLWVAAMPAVLLLSHYTQYLGGDPRQMVILPYGLAVLCAMGWASLKWRPATALALALWAAHGLTSLMALPPEELGAGRAPLRYQPLLDHLRSENVRACYMMDHGYARGYWKAMELTFLCDEAIVFAPPRPTQRLPRYAALAGRQAPAVWVTRFPGDLLASVYQRYFNRPLKIVDVGEFRVVSTGESRRLREIAHLMREDPGYDPRRQATPTAP